MKTFLTLLSYIPLLVVGSLMVALIYSEDYYFIAMKIFAAIGIYVIIYYMYKFTGYLHKKIDRRKV